ncbi:MAG: hypothetical protein M0Q91_17520 [Methanoregula sp.]|jgi:hypothetical protein|nr:hypothetical protein [Methanoregula sp.]
MENNTGKPFNLPKNWEEIVAELDLLMSTNDSNYRERHFLTPSFYVYTVEDKPWNYPLLREMQISLRKRYLSYFLKGQGRVSRGKVEGRRVKKMVWELPGLGA